MQSHCGTSQSRWVSPFFPPLRLPTATLPHPAPGAWSHLAVTGLVLHQCLDLLGMVIGLPYGVHVRRGLHMLSTWWVAPGSPPWLFPVGFDVMEFTPTVIMQRSSASAETWL